VERDDLVVHGGAQPTHDGIPPLVALVAAVVGRDGVRREGAREQIEILGVDGPQVAVFELLDGFDLFECGALPDILGV
jgi:hypothetical protein